MKTLIFSPQEIWSRAAPRFLTSVACLPGLGHPPSCELFRLQPQLQAHPLRWALRYGGWTSTHTLLCQQLPVNVGQQGALEGGPGWRRDFLLLSASLQQRLFPWQRPFFLLARLNGFAFFPTDTASWHPLLRAWVQAPVGSYSKLRDASHAAPTSLRSTFQLRGTPPLCKS